MFVAVGGSDVGDAFEVHDLIVVDVFVLVVDFATAFSMADIDVGALRGVASVHVLAVNIGSGIVIVIADSVHGATIVAVDVLTVIVASTLVGWWISLLLLLLLLLLLMFLL